MNLLGLIGNIFEPATKLIDALHTSEEEKLNAKNELFKLQAQAFGKAEEYEKKLLEAKQQIILAEANSQSVLARNWRPVTMLTFLCLVVLDSFGLLAFRLAEDAWLLLQIGLGGYIVGRSGEKIAPILKKKDSPL
jgi:hypothetical protein